MSEVLGRGHVDEDGRVTLGEPVADRLDLDPGDEVGVDYHEPPIVIEPANAPDELEDYAITAVREDGLIGIPAPARDVLDLDPGDAVRARVREDGKVELDVVASDG